jgi:signal transduction histidine kinase
MGVREKTGTKNQADRGRRQAKERGGPSEPDGYADAGQRLAGLEKKLTQANGRLATYQAVGQRQRAFLSTQTHQIRAQLHVVMGYTELVLRKTRNQLPASQAENLKKLLLSAEGLKAAIEGLADFPWADPDKSPSRKRA